jgi:chromosome segregation ATPase
MRRISSLLALALVSAVTLQPAAAQTARSGGSGGGQSAQLVQQLQQLASERTTMQAEQARMKKELEDLKKERDALKAGQSGLAQRARAESEAVAVRAAREREPLEKELAATKARMQELVDKFRETAKVMREVETDRATVKQALAQNTLELNACVESNNQLYALNDEILTRFSDQGFWSAVTEAEPFTRLKRVHLENIIDRYRTAAGDKQYVPGAAAQGAPPPPATTTR